MYYLTKISTTSAVGVFYNGSQFLQLYRVQNLSARFVIEQHLLWINGTIMLSENGNKSHGCILITRCQCAKSRKRSPVYMKASINVNWRIHTHNINDAPQSNAKLNKRIK